MPDDDRHSGLILSIGPPINETPPNALTSKTARDGSEQAGERIRGHTPSPPFFAHADDPDPVSLVYKKHLLAEVFFWNEAD